MIYFQCSKGHSLAVPLDLAGRPVKCPLCQEIVQAPAAQAAAAPPLTLPEAVPAREDSVTDQIATGAPPRPVAVEEETELLPPSQEPARAAVRDHGDVDIALPRPKKKKREQLRRVRAGLALHFAKYLCLIIGILLFLSGMILAPLASGLEAFALLGYLSANTAAPILGIIGSALSLMVPPKSGGRGLIIGTLACDGVALIFGLLGGLSAAVGGSFSAATVALVFLALSGLAGLSGFILFMLFLRSLALYLDEPGRAEEALSLMILYIFLIFGGIVLLTIAAALLVPRSRWTIVFIFAGEIGLLVALISLLFRILELITDLRNRIQPPKPDLV